MGEAQKKVCKLVEVHCKFFRLGVSHTHTYMFYVDPVHSDRIQFDLLFCFFSTWVFHVNIKQPPAICVIRVDLFSSRDKPISLYLHIFVQIVATVSWGRPNWWVSKKHPPKKIPSIRFRWCHSQRFKPTPWKIQVLGILAICPDLPPPNLPIAQESAAIRFARRFPDSTARSGFGHGIRCALWFFFGTKKKTWTWCNNKNHHLGGGFKYFLFSPLLGEDSHVWLIFVKGVETTN